ncbi:MAG TPA: carbohydrate ABC transporter permease [Firmicutes bacterium]|nr:carbohydrate ABC transporter permease [Bacillota bacterium]
MTGKLSLKTQSRLATAKKYSGKFIINLIIYILLIEFAFTFLYPFIYMILNSLKYDYEVIDATKQWIITDINWNNYVSAFEGLDYMKSLVNTLIVVLGSTLGHIISCSLAGYGFARFKFKGSSLMFGLAMLNLIIPSALMIMPLYIQFSKFHMMGTYLPIILPSFFGFGLKGGIYIFLFRQFFKSLPVSYEEAAKIEGCSMLQVFVRIMLPIARTTILVVFILSVVWHWNDYFEPATYLSGNLQILSQKISSVASASATVTSAVGASVNMTALAACVLVILPLLIVYFIFQKQFMEGVEFSGLAN